MFKITYQVHGSPTLYEIVFSGRMSVDAWMLEMAENVSFCSVNEVFH